MIPALSGFTLLNRVPSGKFNRVKVNIADQFVQINIFLANNGLETVVKKWPMTPVTAIKTDHISGQQSAHQV